MYMVVNFLLIIKNRFFNITLVKSSKNLERVLLVGLSNNAIDL